jgi:phenylacetate-coenzyme A ligase PaaK-like adenylate-forming protein
MRLDFSGSAINRKAFSTRPMTFCEPATKIPLSAICDIIAVETGSREAREVWQAVQLQNLIAFASQRSEFWRTRIGSRHNKNIKLSTLPVLSREDLIEQVKREGSLLQPADGLEAQRHATSGSTGRPTQFYVSSMNMEYNSLRSLAQYFIEGRDLSKNKTLLQHNPAIPKRSLRAELGEAWATPLDGLFRSGRRKSIQYFHPDMAELRAELARHEIGYLVSSPRIMEALLQFNDAEFLHKSGIACWLPVGEVIDPVLVGKLRSHGIPVRAAYSAEEVGMIASECETIPGAYHVATSNVILEVDHSDPLRCGEHLLGRVLISHLHSYATPILRYDLGDFACYKHKCDCGHDGPVVSHIYGKSKSLLKHQDGRVTPFNIRDYEITAIVDCSEYRIRQKGLRTLVVELATQAPPTEAQAEALTKLLRLHADDDLDVQIIVCKRVDWGGNRKRLGFLSEVL